LADKTFVIDSPRAAKIFAQKLKEGISKPVENAEPYFKLLSIEIDRGVQQQFRREGRTGGPRRIPASHQWDPFSANTLFTSPKTLKFNKRPGTDKSKRRRYSFKSKLLQASGGFRKSFRTTNVRKDGLKYQTVHKLGGKIGKSPFRPVLFVTDFDIKRFQNMFGKFIDKGIEF
jgi:phage gpG-like protein